MRGKIFVLFGIISAVVGPATAFAAPFTYGSVSFRLPDTALLEYSTLDLHTRSECSMTTFFCIASSTSSLPSELAERDVILNPQGTLALVRSKLPDGGNQSLLYDISMGSAVLRAAVPVNIRITRFFSNTANTRIVFSTGKEFLVYDLATNEVLRNIEIQDVDRAGFYRMSPLGRYLAYYTYGTPSTPNRRHNLVDLNTGKTYGLPENLKFWDLLSEENRLFEFSPDEKTLVYLDDWPGQPTLYQVDLAKLSGTKFMGTRLIARNYTVADFVFHDANHLFFVANRDTTYAWGLYDFDIRTKSVTKVATNVSYGVGLVIRNGNLFFSRITDTGSEIVAYNLAEKKVKTFVNARPLVGSAIAAGETVRLGGVSGVLIKPVNWSATKSYPLVIWLHGGPYRQTSAGYHSFASYAMYDWLLDNLRKSGVMVLKLDYRGSYGYGKAFAQGLRNNVGIADVADVLNAQKALAARMKLGSTYLMGISYGGYLALRTLVEKPAVFSGAISIAGVADWSDLTHFENALFSVHFGGPDDKETGISYDRSSIISRIGNLSTQKVIVMQGDEDGTIPVKEAYRLQTAFQNFGKSLDLVIYPGEDHVLRYRKTLKDVCERVFGALGISGKESCAAITE